MSRLKPVPVASLLFPEQNPMRTKPCKIKPAPCLLEICILPGGVDKGYSPEDQAASCWPMSLEESLSFLLQTPVVGSKPDPSPAPIAFMATHLTGIALKQAK